jgi:hypothetical protein
LKFFVEALPANFIAHQEATDKLLSSEKTYACIKRSISKILINIEQ